MEVEGLKPGCEPLTSTAAVDNSSPSMLGSDPTRALTARQTAIVAAIRAHVAAHGYPPSVRELGQAVGLNSPSAVAYQLGELARLGAIRRDPDRPRAVAVVDPEPICARCGQPWTPESVGETS